jgi:hypothetical protein
VCEILGVRTILPPHASNAFTHPEDSYLHPVKFHVLVCYERTWDERPQQLFIMNR